MSQSKGAESAVISFAMLALCCGGGAVVGFAKSHYNEHVATCTVTDKDRGNDIGGYRIYTRQCGTLANNDMWFRTKVDSGDVQGQLERGHTYRLRIVGWRFPLLHSFPNVLAVEGEVGQ